VSQRAFEQAERVVVAAAGSFPDGLTAGALASRHGAPLLLTAADQLVGPVADEVTRLSARRVTVVGGSQAIDETVVEQLEGLTTTTEVRRLGGVDRYATAAAVTRTTTRDADQVRVVSGQAFPDALSAANLGSRGPVLLTAQTEVPPATEETLEALAPETATVVGGGQAVSPAVADRIAAATEHVNRVAGDDRYGTAIAAVEAALSGDGQPGPDAASPLVVASGQGFADALAAAPLVNQRGAKLVLAPQRRLTDGLDGFVRGRRSRFEQAVIVGGRAGVGNFAAQELDAALAGRPRPGFTGSVAPLPRQLRSQMTGTSWRSGCPVGLDELRLITLDHWGFDGNVHRGRLVVADQVANQVRSVFAELFAAGFPLARVEPVSVYDGDDAASMAANNTSAFNCRTIAGTDRLSRHAYGTAIDLNPVQNPYVDGGEVAPAAGRPYVDRSDVRPGMITRSGPVFSAFAELGWGWGADFASADDYQHFSVSGG
jgi:poly-gamma-glutamate synthesis protein (capsule biosynthesis protein)